MAEPAADDRSVTDALLMDRIRATWQDHYDIGEVRGSFLACRLTGGPLITADTPAGLESAIRADYARKCAR